MIYNANLSTVVMRDTPDEYGEVVNELLYGEKLELINDNGQWGRVRSLHDHYEGFVLMNSLKFHKDKTHKIFVPHSHIYAAPNFKTDPIQSLYFQSQVSATEERQNGFIKLDTGGWVFETHLMPIDGAMIDHASTAHMFVHAPYIWGGRSIAGIDCSGLVQVCMMAKGISAPRDSGPQCEQLGGLVSDGSVQRGDIVFFEGHVGIMLDESHIINATSRHMRCVIEPLQSVENAYKGIKAIRRV